MAGAIATTPAGQQASRVIAPPMPPRRHAMTGAKIMSIAVSMAPPGPGPSVVLRSPSQGTIWTTSRLAAAEPAAAEPTPPTPALHGIHAYRSLRAAVSAARTEAWRQSCVPTIFARAYAIVRPEGATVIGERGWCAAAATIVRIYLPAWTYPLYARELYDAYRVPVEPLPRSLTTPEPTPTLLERTRASSRTAPAPEPTPTPLERALNMRYAPDPNHPGCPAQLVRRSDGHVAICAPLLRRSSAGAELVRYDPSSLATRLALARSERYRAAIRDQRSRALQAARIWSDLRMRRAASRATLLGRAYALGSRATTAAGAKRAIIRDIARHISVFSLRPPTPGSRTLGRAQWMRREWVRRISARADRYAASLGMAPRTGHEPDVVALRPRISAELGRGGLRGMPGGWAAMRLSDDARGPRIIGTEYGFRWLGKWKSAPGSYQPSTRRLVVGARWLGGARQE
jgi:hypothetical protein